MEVEWVQSIVGGLVGGLVGLGGSILIAHQAAKRKEKEMEKQHTQDRWKAYSELLEFLKATNRKATSHPGASKVKATHIFNSPKDYEWLREHFVSKGHLLSDDTRAHCTMTHSQKTNKDHLQCTFPRNHK